MRGSSAATPEGPSAEARRRGTPPNVVGYLLDEAKAALADAGWVDVETSETHPPSIGSRRGPSRALTGPLRVLRQQIIASGRIALVVSGERAPASTRPGPSRASAESPEAGGAPGSEAPA